MDEGLLDPDFRIGADGDSLLIPVTGPVDGFDPEDHELRPAERPVGDYRHLLHLPEGLQEQLPIAFDVVGDVGMIKIPEEIRRYRNGIGDAMMKANRTLRVVFEDFGVKGDLRVRDLERIAGEGSSETVHREFGARMHTDPAKVYFNPRLAGERHRVASQTRDGEIVIDMFAGVAPFGVQICRAAKPAAVYSIDLNPEAERFALMNRKDNRADALVPISGDANDVVPTLPMADRIIMNLPQIADRFLPLALSRLNRGGTVHMYKIIEREDFPALCSRLVSDAASEGRDVSIDSFELKTYSPTMSVYSLDVHLHRRGSIPARGSLSRRRPGGRSTPSPIRRTSCPSPSGPSRSNRTGGFSPFRSRARSLRPSIPRASRRTSRAPPVSPGTPPCSRRMRRSSPCCARSRGRTSGARYPRPRIPRPSPDRSRRTPS